MVLNKTDSQLSSLKIKELTMNSSWEIIDLSHNSIEFIDAPELLRKQIHLETLRLSFNSKFTGRGGNETIFTNTALKKFECRGCGFTEIQSQHFTELTGLTELLLSANKISRINVNAFKLNDNLTIVDLSENLLQSLHQLTFVELRKMEELSLTKNQIQLLKGMPFLKSKSLKRLVMDQCNITTIYPETFSELPQLEALNLNRNQIESLPAYSFKINLKLKSFSIESNRMRFFSTADLDFFPKITELCIDNNTFDKSIEMTKFVTTYDNRRLRTDNCNDNVEFFIENLFGALSTDIPLEIQNTTEKSTYFVTHSNQGVSDFFIGSYITLILILQAVAFVLLTIYLIKITKYEKLDGEVNYANTILNDDEIYRVYKSNE